MIERETIGAKRESRVRLGPLVWVLLFAALALPAYFLAGRMLFPDKKAAAPARPDYFTRLLIEKPSKATAAPGFALQDLSGRRLSLEDLRGKVVFLNFWATWCVPCRAEMPSMEKLQREFKDQGLVIVAVDVREDIIDVRQFFAEHGLSFTGLLDLDGKVGAEYGAWSLPLTYIIDRKGEFIGKAIGDRKWDSPAARAFFRALLGEEDQRRPGAG
ncbi:MAG TPA: TlpA disulfide reductase family protein [Candidatus Binatia bacterium]